MYLDFKSGCYENEKGSCYLEYGDTQILCQVAIPEKTKILKYSRFELRCSVHFAIRKKNLLNNRRSEKQLAAIVEKALLPTIKRDQMPPWPVDILITVLNNDGCAMSTAITCASLALLDAGVPSFGVMVASTTCFLRGKIIVNPPCK